MPSSTSTFLGALALELRPGEHAARMALDTAQAAQLAEGIARDLAALAPAAADFDLALLAAHYDPVELLRPGWPLHAALEGLVQRAPGLAPLPTSPRKQGEWKGTQHGRACNSDRINLASEPPVPPADEHGASQLPPPLAGGEEGGLRITDPRPDERPQAMPVGRMGWGGGHSRILAFGAHAGALPSAVPSPDTDYAQGSMRLLPLLLRGSAEDGARMATLAQELEDVLLDRGMTGAATALFAQEAFAAPIEHARYLSIHDLVAMMAMQYDHAGLGPLWPLLETALLAPHEQTWLDAPPEPLARYAQGEVRIALLDADGWRAGGFAPAALGDDADRLERAFARFEVRQRQFAAVLAAHGIEVSFDHCPAGADPRTIVSSA